MTVVDRQWLMWLTLQRGQVNTIPEAASAPQSWFNRSTHRLPPTTGIFQQNTSLAGTDRDNIAQLRWWLKSPANVWSCCVLDKVTRVTSLALSCAFPSVHEKMKCYPRWETHNIFQHKGKDRKHTEIITLPTWRKLITPEIIYRLLMQQIFSLDKCRFGNGFDPWTLFFL